MADIDGFFHTSGNTGISVNTYQQVDQQQQRDFERALKNNHQNASEIHGNRNHQTVTPDNVVDGVRSTARLQKVGDVGLPSEVSRSIQDFKQAGKNTDAEKAGSVSLIGQLIDVQA